MAQGMMAIAWARRSSGRMASMGRLPVAGLETDASIAALCFGIAALGGGSDSCALSCGGVFGTKARNSGLVRARKGAVILQERLLCSSATDRRRVAAS